MLQGLQRQQHYNNQNPEQRKEVMEESMRGKRRREKLTETLREGRVSVSPSTHASCTHWVVWKLHQALWSHEATWDPVRWKFLKDISWTTTFCPATTNTVFFSGGLYVNLNSLCLAATRQSVFPQSRFPGNTQLPPPSDPTPKNPSRFSHFFFYLELILKSTGKDKWH